MALVHARGYSSTQRKVTAEIMETQSDLTGYVSRNWKKKTVSGFRSRAIETQEKAGGG